MTTDSSGKPPREASAGQTSAAELPADGDVGYGAARATFVPSLVLLLLHFMSSALAVLLPLVILPPYFLLRLYRRPWQFTLRSLFALTTVEAVILGCAVSSPWLLYRILSLVEMAWLLSAFPLASCVLAFAKRERGREFPVTVSLARGLVAAVLAGVAVFGFCWLTLIAHRQNSPGSFSLGEGLLTIALTILAVLVASVVTFVINLVQLYRARRNDIAVDTSDAI